MSPVALILNLALGVLLIGAIVLGQRLDKRLRALRESHNSFAKAVSELDYAAQRTQEGLNELKATAERARTDLADRLDEARSLAARLTKLAAEAQSKTEALERIHAQVKAPRPILLRGLGDPKGSPAVPAQAHLEARPVPASRSRAPIDDELFENRPNAAAAGGRS